MNAICAGCGSRVEDPFLFVGASWVCSPRCGSILQHRAQVAAVEAFRR